MSSTTNVLTPSLHRAGVALVTTAGFVSLICILALCAFLAYKALTRQVGAGSPVTLLKSQFGALYVGLIIADSMQSIAFISSLARLEPKTPDHVAPSCTAQAVLLNAGDVGSACFNIAIALHTMYVVLRKKKPPSWSIMVAIGMVFAMMLLFTLVGPFAVADAGVPFYNDTGFWCWIDKHYNAARLYLHYVWVFLAAAVSICSYCCIFVALYFRKKFDLGKQQEAARKLDELAKRMLYFPIVYLINILPIAIARCLVMAGHTVPWGYLLFAGTIFALNGAFNVALFGRTHHLIKFKFPAVARRKSMMPESQLSLSLPLTRPTMSTRKYTDTTLDRALEKGPLDSGESVTIPVVLVEGEAVEKGQMVDLDEKA